MFTKSLEKYTKKAPQAPGCYIYRNSQNKVLYVGKAKNISKRIHQYFHNYPKLEPKIQLMLDRATNIEFVTTDNEIEALVLEANLIKKYKPKYNKNLKDDKRYVWIKIEKNEDFPRLVFAREKTKGGEYFGPFPSKHLVENLLKRLRHIFPYRDCSRNIEEIDGKIRSSDPKPCLYYHIGLCDAPCTSKISKKDYKKNINKIRQIFKGNVNAIINDLRKQMAMYSKKLDFEEAAKIRDKLNEFIYVTEHVLIEYGMDEIDFEKAKEKEISTALNNLVQKLKIEELKARPGFKIECYDISNTQGKNATGSMVVFVDGKPKKAFYRKFKINTKDTPDDFAMMQEVLERRLKRIGTDDKSFGTTPDLIIVDGGKGQLSSSFETLNKHHSTIPIIGLAKREEEIFKIRFDEDNKIKFSRILLKKKTPELYLIQRIRDEAHRFAITYHRKIRGNSQLATTLDSIPGVGTKTKKKLLLEFGSWEGVKKAKKEDIGKIVKNSRTLSAILKQI